MDTTPILLRLKYRRRAKNQKLVYVQVFLETPDRVYNAYKEIRNPKGKVHKKGKKTNITRFDYEVRGMVAKILRHLREGSYTLSFRGFSPELIALIRKNLARLLQKKGVTFAQPTSPTRSAAEQLELGTVTADLIGVAYTDGSSYGNPGPAGWAYVLKKEKKHGYFFRKSSNTMELKALLELLKDIPDGSTVEVHTDSRFMMRILAKKWKAEEDHIVQLERAIRTTIDTKHLGVRSTPRRQSPVSGPARAHRRVVPA